MILDKFFVKLGYEYDKEKMEKFNKGVKSTLGFMKKLAIAAIGLATSMGIMYSKFANKVLAQKRLGQQFNTTREELEGINRAANELTGSRSGANRLLDMLSDLRARKEAGLISEQDLETFSRLRLSLGDLINKSLPDRILAVSKAIQAQGKREQRRTFVRGGFDAEAQNFVLGLTAALLKKITPEKFNTKNIEKLNNIFSRMADTFGDDFLKNIEPLVEKMIPVFEDLLSVIPKLTKSFTKLLTTTYDFIEKEIGKRIFNIQKEAEFFFQNPSSVFDLGRSKKLQAAGIGIKDAAITINNNINTASSSLVKSLTTNEIAKSINQLVRQYQNPEKN